MVPMEPVLRSTGVKGGEIKKTKNIKNSNDRNYNQADKKLRYGKSYGEVSGKIEWINNDRNGDLYGRVKFDSPFRLDGRAYFYGMVFQLGKDVEEGKRVRGYVSEVNDKGVIVKV